MSNDIVFRPPLTPHTETSTANIRPGRSRWRCSLNARARNVEQDEAVRDRELTSDEPAPILADKEVSHGARAPHGVSRASSAYGESDVPDPIPRDLWDLISVTSA